MKKINLITVVLLIHFISFSQVIHIPNDYPSIQSGIDASNDGDTVLVDQGTYFENINFLGKAITVASKYLLEKDSANIYNTIINGSQPSPGDSACVVLLCSGEDTTSVLYGFTITGGTGCYWPQHPKFTKLKAGGGIQIINCGAKICHNIVTNNHVENEWEAFGGGIHGADIPEDRMIIVEDNLVYNNTVTGKIWVKGGGIAVAYCHTRICNNIVRNNTAIGDSITVEIASGGIWYSNGLTYTANVNISGNTIINNEVISTNPVSNLTWGGGMIVMARWDNMIAKVNDNIIADNFINSPLQSSGNGLLINQCDSIEVTNNVIYGNASNAQTSFGGGICVWDSHPLLSQNLVYNNSATRGGGIYIAGQDISYVQIINNTIYGNDATIGGGIYFNSSLSELRNSIIWGNNATSAPSIYQAVSLNNKVNYSDVQGGWTGIGEENIDLDPLFYEPDFGDFHLKQNSPCIDAGDPNSPPDPDGSICDMGVFYYDSLWTEIQDEKPVMYSTKYYPNPFTTSTTIEYELDYPQVIKIIFYNQFGKQVDVIERSQQTGLNKVVWTPKNLTEGIYYFRLRAGEKVASGKMVLVR